MSTSRSYATNVQIAHLLKTSIAKIDELVRRENLPRAGRNKFDVVKVVHWLITRHHHLIELEKIKRFEWTLQEIADLLKLDIRSITKLVKEQNYPRISRGMYDIMLFVPRYITDLRKQIALARAGGESTRDLKDRILKSDAQMKEMELARKRGEVITIDDVIKLLEEPITITRTRILTVPKLAAPQMEGLETNGEREEILKQIIHDCLNDLTAIPDRVASSKKILQERHAEGMGIVRSSSTAQRKRMGKRKKSTKR